ncbi:hypothetical protein CORC01_13086 [Colletotrichum orchidophilum]|uniref:Uncharacterized protein n=1 Tax=Colletotrichum orchidophilum TaxID=1209926 RepID=A0A1G4AR26_9PEZI|nr:uncharacterized protein CORC01_13086 [Colletotrichum orchidophilum]OHE91609.1 hypothetical protein CORC01_13086 [Colletotrichum orchidophilum]
MSSGWQQSLRSFSIRSEDSAIFVAVKGGDMGITETLTAADRMHLHRVEAIVPWDWYRFPVWAGTPLYSVIGWGPLPHLTELPWDEWDKVFHRTLRQWLRIFRDAGVNLLQYGRDEMPTLNSATAADLRGAFSADAVAASQRYVRNPLNRFDYGSQIQDWRLWWAPEFEAFAAKFWTLFDRPKPVIPRSWVEL